MSLFITFEGCEGAGKTTQLKKAGEFLRRKDIPLLVTREPGGTDLGQELRNVLLNKSSLNITVRTEILLFLADRAQHVGEVIRPALERGVVVLCDRYADATIAYQGFGRGCDVEELLGLSNYASQALVPDATILFDVPPETGIQRVNGRVLPEDVQEGADRFERERLSFHQRVREGYLWLAKHEPDRFYVIDGTGSLSDVHAAVCTTLEAIFRGKNVLSSHFRT